MSRRASLDEEADVEAPLMRPASRSPYVSKRAAAPSLALSRPVRVAAVLAVLAFTAGFVMLISSYSSSFPDAASAARVGADDQAPSRLRTPIPVDEHGVCGRVLVHRFDSKWGFGSEFSIYLRVAALEGAFGSAVVPYSAEWIYGDLEHFFLPADHACTLPPNASDTLSMPTAWFGFGSWRDGAKAAVWRDVNMLRVLDDWVRNTSVDTRATRLLAARERLFRLEPERAVLPYGESVPPGVELSFAQQADAMARIARPTPRMQSQIDRLAARLGLDQPDTSLRRPVVALQIRFGDKRTEQGDVKLAGTHLEFGDLVPYFHAAQLATARLFDPDLTPPPRTFPSERRNASKPLLVVMTAELDVVERLQALDAGHEFEIIQSPSAEFSPEEEEEYLALFGPKTATDTDTASVPGASTATTATDPPAHTPRVRFRRWEQAMLYSASESLRLAMTRQLIAELVVYAQRADAFVVSGNSNMGRLALLLAGPDGVGGPGVGGRVRSIDVPFYPTAYRRAIFPPDLSKDY